MNYLDKYSLLKLASINKTLWFLANSITHLTLLFASFIIVFQYCYNLAYMACMHTLRPTMAERMSKPNKQLVE